MGWWDIADIVRSARSAIQGRLKHNTHVANNASTPVKAVLKFNDDEVAFMTVDPGSYICFPTPKGRVELWVIPRKEGAFGKFASAKIGDSSDISFIVKQTSNGDLQLAKSKYGSIWQEA